MSDALLSLLKFGLLVALYVFFAWVLWAAVSQIRAPAFAATAAPAPARRRRGSGGSIVILEPAELAGATMSIDGSLTIGRAAACSLTLDDTFVSQQHASIVHRDGKFFAEDQGSTNGTFVNRHRITSSVVLQPGDRVQIGSTVLEFA